MSSALSDDSQLVSYNATHTAKAEPVTRVDLGEFSRDLLRGIRRLHHLHGPIAAIEDRGQRVVFLFSPEFNQQVLSDSERFHARFFAVRGPKYSAQRRLTCGLLAMNGEQHRRNFIQRHVRAPARVGIEDLIQRIAVAVKDAPAQKAALLLDQPRIRWPLEHVVRPHELPVAEREGDDDEPE